MPGVEEESTKPGRGRALILYDGACGLCGRLIRFVLNRDPEGRFDFASLQGTTGQSILRRFGRPAEVPTTVYVVAEYRSVCPRLLEKSEAALFVMQELRAAGIWVRLLRMVPRSLLDLGYEVVARNRYRFFGRTEACFLPMAEFRERFLDR